MAEDERVKLLKKKNNDYSSIPSGKTLVRLLLEQPY